MFNSRIPGRTAPEGREPNMAGDTYGRLTLVSEIASAVRPTKRKWSCVCSCGNTTESVLNHLRQGRSRSCGCLTIETSMLPRLPTIVDGRVARIHLGHDKWAIVAIEHLEIVEGYTWCYSGGYAVTGNLRLHQLLCPCDKGKNPDHIDGNGLNNVYAPGELINNLRPATKSQNSANVGQRSDNTSGKKGVSRRGPKWRAAISYLGQTIHLGYFTTPELAHEAYCQAALKYHGEFARTE